MQFFFTFQSPNVNFSEWVWLITLALAPLIAHLFISGPQIVILGHPRPALLEQACLYNPTTTIWRYYAIAFPRVGAVDWTSFDMATANTAFWTGRHWDGSENMATDSRASCTRAPKRSRATIMSNSTAQTLAGVLQLDSSHGTRFTVTCSNSVAKGPRKSRRDTATRKLPSPFFTNPVYVGPNTAVEIDERVYTKTLRLITKGWCRNVSRLEEVER